MVDISSCHAVVNGTGRAVTRERCTPIPLTTAYMECRNRRFQISFDEFRTTPLHHGRGCMLNQVQMESVKRIRMHKMVLTKLSGRQLTGRSQVQGLL
jgi:hypothetical protein